MEPTEKEIAEYEEHEWHDDKYDMRGMKLNVHCPHCWPALRKPATR